MKKILYLPVTVFLFLHIFFSVNAQENFSIVFMADVHYHEKNNAPEAMSQAIDTINKINPDFVLVGGDIIYDVLRQNEAEARNLCEFFLEKASEITVPVHYAIGNHEHFGLYNRDVEECHPLFGKKLFEKYFGERYYSFNHKGWHIVVLDDMEITSDRKYIGRVDSIQMEWLKNDLALIADTTPIILMAHVPLITTLSQWYGGGTRANTNRVAIENSHEVIKLFAGKNLKLILQGHIHYFEALNIMNNTLVISAPSFSGKWWMGKQHGLDEGFVRLDIEKDNQITYTNIKYRK